MIYSTNDIIKLLIASCFLGMLIGSLWTYTVTIKRRKKLLGKIQDFVHSSNEIIEHAQKMNEMYKRQTTPNSVNIEFTGSISNDKLCAINIARFVLPNNRVITIDRDSTEFYSNEGKYSMVWKNCYIWDVRGKTYLTREAIQFVLKDVRFLEFEVDDDVPVDYSVNVDHWQIIY